MIDPLRTGFVSLLGRPNVGKSTLLNRIIGRKISITSRRPQTTRHRILGIKTTHDSQIVFVDTPGLHRSSKRAMSTAMNRAARGSVEGVDLVALIITAGGWVAADHPPLDLVRTLMCPVILVINKIDRLKDKTRLLPLIQTSTEKAAFVEIVPLSAKTGENVAQLEAAIIRHLPEGLPGFPKDQVTDRSERFMAAELVREQLFSGLGQELPYATAVEIENFSREDKHIRVEAIIWVERQGQKAIVIGRGGERLKGIGTRARMAMEQIFCAKVFLGLWVKVRENWTDNAMALRALGYLEDS